MERQTYNFTTFYYVPLRVGLFGLCFLGSLALIIFTHFFFWGGFLLLLSALLLTTHYGIQIDTANKTYQDYLSVLGIRSGETVKYQKIDYVFVKPARESQTMNSMVTSRTFEKDTFDGYIKFDETEKVYLLSNQDKKIVIKKLEEIGTALNVEIIDHTV